MELVSYALTLYVYICTEVDLVKCILNSVSVILVSEEWICYTTSEVNNTVLHELRISNELVAWLLVVDLSLECILDTVELVSLLKVISSTVVSVRENLKVCLLLECSVVAVKVIVYTVQ